MTALQLDKNAYNASPILNALITASDDLRQFIASLPVHEQVEAKFQIGGAEVIVDARPTHVEFRSKVADDLEMTLLVQDGQYGADSLTMHLAFPGRRGDTAKAPADAAKIGDAWELPAMLAAFAQLPLTLLFHTFGSPGSRISSES